MLEAFGMMGSSFQEASTGVITKKYGEQAGEAASTGMDVGGNVYKTSKVSTKKIVKGAIKEEIKI